MQLSDIVTTPTSIDKVHESCFRSYHILQEVMEMVNRNDSVETINKMVTLLKSFPYDAERSKPEGYFTGSTASLSNQKINLTDAQISQP